MTERDHEIAAERERFRTYLDDEMSVEERAEFEADMAANDELKAEFEIYRSTVELLHRVGPMEAPPTLLPAIQKRMAGRHMRENYGATIRFPYEVLAFVIMLGCVFYLYFTQLPGNPGAILQKARPQVVEVELSRPAPASVEAAYGLQIIKTDRPFERTVYGTYTRAKAAQLLDDLAPTLVTPMTLPKGTAEQVSMVVTSPAQ